MHAVDHEALVQKLKDPAELEAFMVGQSSVRPGWVASSLGWLLVGVGTVMYGRRPSYEKFKAIEVIARIPYQSWESVAYTLLTAFYSDELRAIRLSKILPFTRHAQDNETMHVVVISQLVKRRRKSSFIRHTLIPLIFSFFYFWAVWILSIFDKRGAFELNFIFETHAFHQYSDFIKENEATLTATPVDSAFLRFYGREVQNEYDLFNSIRIDEAIHREASWRMAEELSHKSIS